MNWLKDLALGDVVYIVPADRRFNRPYHAIVTKQGRKLIHFKQYDPETKVAHGLEVKADMTNTDYVMTFVNVGSGSPIYRSFESYTDQLSVMRMRRRIEDRLRYGGPRITEDEIRKIAAILNINGDPDE